LQQPAGGEHGDHAPITGTAATAAIPEAKAAAASVRAAAIAAAAGIATATGIATAATTTTAADGSSGPSAADAGHATATMVQTDAAVTGDTATTALSLAAAASSPAAAAALANDAAGAADRAASTADDSKTTADGATGPAAAATADAVVDTATATAAAAAQAAAATAAVAVAVAAATTGAPAAALAMSTAGLAAGAAPIARALPDLVGAGGPDKHARSDADGPVSADTSIAAAGTGQSGVTFDTSPTPILKVNAGVETPEFAQGLAERVSTMVDANLTSARLQVNPPQLGPIEVRIAVQGDHALVWLASHSAVTRDALESSSSKLREMLGAQGFAQVSVDISQRHFQERPAPSQLYDNAPAAESVASTATVAGPAASRARLSAGALDAYA
jgi:flagellar hook-length control protein FliK